MLAFQLLYLVAEAVSKGRGAYGSRTPSPPSLTIGVSRCPMVMCEQLERHARRAAAATDDLFLIRKFQGSQTFGVLYLAWDCSSAHARQRIPALLGVVTQLVSHASAARVAAQPPPDPLARLPMSSA